ADADRIKEIATDVGGEGGIRTPDTVARMPHFECGAFNHSATSPSGAECGEIPAARAGVLANAAHRNKLSPRRRSNPISPHDQPPHSLADSLPFCRLVKRALPSPVPIVSTPQRLTSRMNGTSLRP